MEVVVLGSVVAVIAWAIWDGDREKRNRQVRRTSQTLTQCGLAVVSHSSKRVELKVVDSGVYNASPTEKVKKACEQIIGGPLELNAQPGCVIATRKEG